MDLAAASAIRTSFHCGLDAPLPEIMFTGNGSLLHLRGWCYSTDGIIDSLSVAVDGVETPFRNHSWARADVFAEQCPAKDATGNSLLSGFEGFVAFAPVPRERPAHIVLRARLRRAEVVERTLGIVSLRPGYGAQPAETVWPDQRDPSAAGPRVAICMAVFNPPPALFKAQVASLQAQTHRNWVCIITDDSADNEQLDRVRFCIKDDPRFILFPNPRRLDFYWNFQEGLRRVPGSADFVALCDQDDLWYPDKLASLLGAFEGGQEDGRQLVYSDARVVSHAGAVQAETFWGRRGNNYTDLATLMVANTITGAASMFRASLLPDILPFPEPVGPAFHDHWIGLVALVKGSIGYVDRPLYDYIQHADGVIGHNYNDWPGVLTAVRQVARRTASALLHRRPVVDSVAPVLKQSLEDYVFVLQKVMLARTLLLRNPDAPPGKRATLERFGRFETSILAAMAEKLDAVRQRRPTLNLEGMFLWSMTGARLRNVAFRLKRRELLRLQAEAPGTRLLNQIIPHARRTGDGHLAQPLSALPAPAQGVRNGTGTPALEYGAAKWIYHNITPLSLDCSREHPKRVNLLLATINFKYVFGGYIGMFNLALRLAREGYRVRIILHEQTDWNLEEWRRQIQNYPGITTLFDEVEVISRFDRTIPVEVNPDDRFVATNCWAAHVAHNTARMLDEKAFLFMIQEYEPFFLAMNSINAVFQQAYTFPQLALFSTELLQEFFRIERIGVYAQPGGDDRAAVFSNAIQRFEPTSELMRRKQRRVLFYARVEEHASRNLFEIGVIALATLVRDPRVNLTNWSFHGVGSLDGEGILELAPGVPLRMLPKVSLQEYIDLMPGFDVGLSLMMTPHPSLVPLEMASAGMVVVTNTFANKTQERLQAISSNLIGAEPSVEAVRDGLIAAMARADDIEARMAGARVAWPRDWDAAFPAEGVAKIRAFLGAP